jgi:hypothetical protein
VTVRPLIRGLVQTGPRKLLGAQRGGGQAGLPYSTQGRDFDGTNDYALRGGTITGIAAGKTGLLSLWVRFYGGDGTLQAILMNGASTASSRLSLVRTATNTFNVLARNNGLTAILNLLSSTTYLTSDTWLHVLASWDLALGIGQLYVNDADVKSGAGTQTDENIPYTSFADWSIGAETDAGSKLNGGLSEIFFHTPAAHFDISIAANRRKFITAAGKPVDLGTDGSTPLGLQPLLYMPHGDPADNRGTGGNFTVTGTLEPSALSPSGDEMSLLADESGNLLVDESGNQLVA